MSTRALQAILCQDNTFGSLNARMQSLASLQQTWQSALPLSLRAHSHVIGTEGSRLLVQAASSAMVAKLRQLTPSLTRAMAQAHPELDTLRIQVAPAEYRPPVQHRLAQPLSPETLSHFETLAEALPPSSLKTAIARLLQSRQHLKTGG